MAPPVGPINRLIINYFYTIENHSCVSVAKSDIKGLPFTGRFLSCNNRFDTAVDCSHIMRIKFLFIRIDYLDLIHPPKVHSAVTSRRYVYFKLKVKILKFLFRSEVSIAYMSRTFRLNRIINKCAVNNFKSVSLFFINEFPACQVFAIKQINRICRISVLSESGAGGTGGSFVPMNVVVSTDNPFLLGDRRIPLILSPSFRISIHSVTTWVLRGLLFSSLFLNNIIGSLNRQNMTICEENS